jgi:hypothetical protein
MDMRFEGRGGWAEGLEMMGLRAGINRPVRWKQSFSNQSWVSCEESGTSDRRGVVVIRGRRHHAGLRCHVCASIWH